MTAVLTWLTGSTLGRWIAATLLTIGAIAAALLAAFSRGEKSQQLKQQAQASKATATAIRINAEIQQMPRDERREALKKWSKG